MKKTDETFLKIINGDLPSYKIYEDEYTYAFLSIGPVSRGHTLVIPKKFAENIYDIDDDSLAHVMSTVAKLCRVIKKSLNPSGINIVQNNELGAEQAIFHIHFHVIPRYENDNLPRWQPIKEPIEEFHTTARTLIDELKK
jgi:histidine triad (HIT) family protein